MTDINLWNLFIQGGAFMWPLLALSVISIILIIERLVFFVGRQYQFMKNLQEGVTGDIPETTNNPLLKVIRSYKGDLSLGEDNAMNVGGREASRQINQHERGLKALATIGAISPLVGLLGTVWGMVKAFAKMAEHLKERYFPS